MRVVGGDEGVVTDVFAMVTPPYGGTARFPLHLVYVRVGMIPAWYLHVLLGYGERLPVLCPHGAV